MEQRPSQSGTPDISHILIINLMTLEDFVAYKWLYPQWEPFQKLKLYRNIVTKFCNSVNFLSLLL